MKLVLEIPTFVDAIMDQTKGRMLKVSFCLLLVEMKFSAYLQIVLSYLFLVVEVGCFSEQKELRIRIVKTSSVPVVVVEIEMMKAELPGDNLIHLFHRFYTISHQDDWKTCMMRITNRLHSLP